MLIWLIGLICSIWCVLDILKKDISLVAKVIVAVIVLLTSWIGLAVQVIAFPFYAEPSAL